MTKSKPKPKPLTGAPANGREALAAYFAAQLAASRVSDAVDAAQDVIFEAWEQEDPGKRVAMARQALSISRDCADAYVLLADAASSAEEAVELLRQGVAAGERALGPEAFEQDIGMFWGLLETRPYMRARIGLALALWDASLRAEAVTHCEALLRLNPNDNQGVRYILVNWLQLEGRDSEAQTLLRRYKNDGSAALTWPAALAAFRRLGDCQAARKALERADAANRYVAGYLLKTRKPPRRRPDYVSAGGADEAADLVEACAMTWQATPGAIDWVAAVLTRSQGRRSAQRQAGGRRRAT